MEVQVRLEWEKGQSADSAGVLFGMKSSEDIAAQERIEYYGQISQESQKHDRLEARR